MYLAWGVILFMAAAWLVHVIAPNKGANIWIRLGSIALGLFMLLGLWGLVTWIWHLVRK